MFQKILCVGLNCFDIIQICKNYPLEDSEQRSIEYRMQRGGNASNSSTVLSLLGSTCEFMGTISKKTFWEFIQKDFEKYCIDISGCKIYNEYQFPVSTIIINSQNGSRTIVHSNKDLPELDYEHFKNIDFRNYSWIHFEGRNVSEVSKMMKCVNDYNNFSENSITISVELEMRKEALCLATLANIIFVGKEFSKNHNWDGMEKTLTEMRKHVKPSSTVISIWGKEGAMASNPEGTFSAPAYPPVKEVDTLGAGDTFIGGFIHNMSKGKDLNESLHSACKIAGFKVGTYGYDELKNFKESFQDSTIHYPHKI